MKKLALHWKIIIGLVLGIIWAFLSSYLGWSDFTGDWIAPWGTIFINALKLIAIPLVLFSIIKGIMGLSDVSNLGRMGVKTLGLYLITTLFAVSLGLTIVNVLKPGEAIAEDTRIDNRIAYELWAKDAGVPLKDGKCFSCQTQYANRVAKISGDLSSQEAGAKVKSKIEVAKKTKDAGPLSVVVDMVPSNIFLSLSNNGLMLQIIVFAIFFGVVMLMIPAEKTVYVVGFIEGMNEIFLMMVDVVMKGAPFFVFALLAGKMSEMAGDNPAAVVEIFKGLGWYSLYVALGLALMVFVLYPSLMKLIVRKIPYTQFFKGIGPAQMLAFSTSSSAATLPVTMECVNDNLKVSKRITSFVLPIGATVNMDGTSLYQAIAVIFLAQMHMVDLDLTQQLTIVLTATLASIGAAAVPSAGLVMLIIVLESVGLNPAWIAIIFPVDRILDMCRTVVNVTGDATVSSIIAHSEGELNYVKEEES
jgi:Na+/H+-dicarboxylate symporter